MLELALLQTSLKMLVCERIDMSTDKELQEKAVRDFINWFVSPDGAINVGTQTIMNMMHSAASRYFADKKTAPKG